MTSTHELPTLIRAEYLEMPGLRLTLSQAVRMWNTSPQSCVEILDGLVQVGFLWKEGPMYLRADSGRRHT